MKYLKKYESHQDLLNSLKDLSGKLSSLKTLASLHSRKMTPNEIFEDYFLEFKEVEKFYYRIDRPNHGIGPVTISLYTIVDKTNIESEFNRYLKKLQSIKSRLEELHAFNCHFVIKLNGKPQSDLDTNTHKNDDYKFKGIGNSECGYDSNGIYYGGGLTGQPPFPKDKVSITIDFLII